MDDDCIIKAINLPFQADVYIFVNFSLLLYHFLILLQLDLPNFYAFLELALAHVLQKGRPLHSPLYHVVEKKLLRWPTAQANHQVFSPDGQKNDFLRASGCPLPHLITPEAVFPEALSGLEGNWWLPVYGDFYTSFDEDVEGGGVVVGFEDSLIFFVLESIHIVGDGILLLVVQKAEHRDLVHQRFGDLIVLLHHLLLGVQKDLLGETPEATVLQNFHWGRSRSWVNQSKLSEKVSLLQLLHRLSRHFNRHSSRVDNEKHASGSALFEDILPCSGIIKFHRVGKPPSFCLPQLIEKEVASKDLLNETNILVGLQFGESDDIFEDLIVRDPGVDEDIDPFLADGFVFEGWWL